MEYTLYFQMFGKKFKYKVEAISEQDAIDKLHNKIEIDKVERPRVGYNPFKDLIGDDMWKNWQDLFNPKK